MDNTITKIEFDLIKNMYHNQQIIPEVTERINYKAISQENKALRAIFWSIIHLWYEEKSINLLSIENKATIHYSGKDLFEYLDWLTDNEPENDWEADLEFIVDRVVRSRVKTGCENIVRMVDNKAVTLDVVSDRLHELSELTLQYAKQEEDVNTILENDSIIPVYHPVLGTMLSGISRGDIFTIGAEAAHGKTTLALELTNSWIDNGFKVLFESIEMTFDQVWKKIASRRAKIDSNWTTKRWSEFKTGRIKVNGEYINCEEDHKRFVSEIEYLKENMHNKTLKVRQYSNSVSEIKLDARKFKPDILVIDWVQMMEMPRLSDSSSFTNMAQGIPEILKTIKALGKRLNFATVLVSQIECGGKRPTINDFTDSKSFKKYSADIVALFYAYQAVPLTSTKHIIEIRQLKDRFGASGSIAVCEFKREWGEIGNLIKPEERQKYLSETKGSRRWQ